MGWAVSHCLGRSALDHGAGPVKILRLMRVLPLLAAVFLAAPPVAAADLLVFAAASLRNALDAADMAYQRESGTRITVSYAASGTLAKQIENGAPADLFFSADPVWMDYVEAQHLLKAGSRIDLLGNRLVLIAAKDSRVAIEIKPGFDFAALLGRDRLAIGDPVSVPAGSYAKAALEKLGLWGSLQGRLAPTADVRAALTLVSRGEAPLGIVYASDVAADPGVKIVARFPPESHPPIIYPLAVLAHATKPEADAYRAWLASPSAAPFFEQQGFTVRK
jgi:molybdate transport system substrate-binding protein